MEYPEFIARWRDDADFIICHTSGSTGEPKEIKLPKALMVESALRTVRHFGLSSTSHLHSCISPDYIGGKMMAVRAEITGGRLTWEKPTNRPLADYDGGSIDLLAVVPSQMADLLDRVEKLPEIRHIIIGGAPIPAKLRKKIAESGLDAWETYGMTETGSHIALRPVSSSALAFRPLEGIQISCDNEGRLVIDMGKWGTFHTNDIVSIDYEGGFHVIGRADNVIITGGKKVHPEAIEAKLEEILGRKTMITSEDDEKWGQRVILIVEEDAERDKIQENSVNEIMQMCRRELSAECVPKEIRLGKIPLTANGKKKRTRKNDREA